MTNDAPERQRVVDTTAKDARLAVADAAGKLEPLRARIAVISQRAARRPSQSDRRLLDDECAAIKQALADLRTDLTAKLIDKPRKVLAHSRVTDIEKALDNLEASLSAVEGTLRS